MADAADPRDYLPLMAEAIRKTKKTGNETGFSVCEKLGELMVTKLCEGDACGVKVDGCEWNHTALDFHTHPEGGTVPSPRDVWTQMLDNSPISCVGNKYKRGSVQCWELNHDSKDLRKFIDRIKASMWSGEHDVGAETDAGKLIFDSLIGRSDLIKRVARFEGISGRRLR